MTVKLIVKYKKILSTTRQEVKYSAPKEFVFFQQLLYQTPVMRPIRLQRPPTKISTVRRKQSHAEIYASSSGRQHRCPIMFPPREKLSPCALSINQSEVYMSQANQSRACSGVLATGQTVHVHCMAYAWSNVVKRFSFYRASAQQCYSNSVHLYVCLSVRPSVCHVPAGASTPYKRWSKCTMEKVGENVFFQKFRGEVH